MIAFDTEKKGNLRIVTPSQCLYYSRHIRPLAVSPLAYPESVLNPWGFLISGVCSTRSSGGEA